MKGKIKRIEKSLGVVFDIENNNDYLFTITGESSFKKNDIVSFELKKNNRNVYHAHSLELIERQIKKKSSFFFEDKNDLHIGLNYINNKIRVQLERKNDFKEPESLENQINIVLGQIEDILNGPYPNINDLKIEDINLYIKDSSIERGNTNYWLNKFDIEEFAQNIIQISNYEVVKGKKIDYSITWHQWKDDHKQIFTTGYNQGHFNYSYIDKGETEQTHIYDSPPPETEWDIFKIEQKDNVFYIGSAPVNEIAQSSYVPSLPPKMKIDDTASRIIDSTLRINEWQREVDTNRIRKIQQFIEDTDNIIANTPMIFIKDTNAVEINTRKLKINYTKFLKQQDEGDFEGKFIDRKKRPKKDNAGNVIYDDYRPLWLIDGQHRIKGIHRSKEQQNLMVPIIIFPNDFGTNQTAKVFAEINTLQKKLNPLHELFMQHRFSIDHVNPKRKFKDFKSKSYIDAVNNNWSKDWEHSRANHLAYEIAALMAKKGVLKNRIQFLPQNGNSKDILISADQWVNYSRDLFYSKCYRYIGEDITDYIDFPSVDDLSLTQRQVFHNEIENYFKAWQETCNHEGWKKINHTEKWIDGTKGKALIQKKSHFIILIELYNIVRIKALNYKIANKERGILKKEHFLEILKVFKWVDWTDSTLLNTYGGGGEKGRRSLEAWMADAILSEKENSYEEIHNSNPEENKSKAGKGIISYLATPIIEKASNHHWPMRNQSLKFKSKRPENARYESTWSVFDKDENLLVEGKSSVPKHSIPMEAEFQLKYKREMENLDKLIIQVEWKNAHTRTGKSKITIEKLK